MATTKYAYSIDELVFEIKELDLNIVTEWDNEVQPLIDGIHGRSDNGWRWKHWYALSFLLNLIGQNAKGFCIYLYGIPVGMFFGVFSYKCKEKKHNIDIPAYLWLVSKNPELDTILDEIEEIKGSRPKVYFLDMVFDILLKEVALYDNIISFWLHASPHGEDPLGLLNYYKRKGLVECPLLRRATIRRDDGRYMFYPL